MRATGLGAERQSAKINTEEEGFSRRGKYVPGVTSGPPAFACGGPYFTARPDAQAGAECLLLPFDLPQPGPAGGRLRPAVGRPRRPGSLPGGARARRKRPAALALHL